MSGGKSFRNNKLHFFFTRTRVITIYGPLSSANRNPLAPSLEEFLGTERYCPEIKEKNLKYWNSSSEIWNLSEGLQFHH